MTSEPHIPGDFYVTADAAGLPPGGPPNPSAEPAMIALAILVAALCLLCRVLVR